MAQSSQDSDSGPSQSALALLGGIGQLVGSLVWILAGLIAISAVLGTLLSIALMAVLEPGDTLRFSMC